MAFDEAGWFERTLYLEADHLNSPIAARDQSGKTVWRWESDAFGSLQPNQDPDGDGRNTIINLRFPGQYYDAETGLHQNWHRTYDPLTGRYISSDPIGVEGGSNGFDYAQQNPLSYVDPKGLTPMPDWWTDGWRPRYPASRCVTAECVAGLLPAPSENRSVEQIEADLNKRICEMACGFGIPIPGTALPKSACEIPKRAAEYFGKDVASSGVCTLICK